MPFKNEAGFSAIGGLLTVVVVGIIGLTGWFVWHVNQNAKNVQSQFVDNALHKVDSFEECKAATDSKILETYPEQCVAKDGKVFSGNSQKYFVIKEWGVKIPLSSADEGVYYKLFDTEQSVTNPIYLTVFSNEVDELVGPTGASCKGEYVAYLMRLPAQDPNWQQKQTMDDGRVDPRYNTRVDIGDYRYALATKKEYGPECFEKSVTGPYAVDEDTEQKFDAVVKAFVEDFKKLKAN